MNRRNSFSLYVYVNVEKQYKDKKQKVSLLTTHVTRVTYLLLNTISLSHFLEEEEKKKESYLLLPFKSKFSLADSLNIN